MEARLDDGQGHERERVAPMRPGLAAPQSLGLVTSPQDWGVHQDRKRSARGLHTDASDELDIDEVQHEPN